MSDEIDYFPNPGVSAPEDASSQQPNASGNLVNESAESKAAPVDYFPDKKDRAPEQPSMIGDLIRGIDNMKGMGGGLAALLGNATNLGGLEDWGQQVYQSNNLDSQLHPAAVPTLADIRGPGDALSYLKSAIVENGPMFIPMLAGGGVGGFIAKDAAETVAKNMVADIGQEAAEKLVAKRVMIGRVLGGAAVDQPTRVGGMYEDILGRTGQKDPGLAALAGTTQAFIDAVPEAGLLENVLGRAAAGKFTAGLIKRAGEEGAKNFLKQGSAQGMNQIIEQAAISHEDGSDIFSNQNIAQQIDAFVKGGGVGGALGMATAPFMKPHPDSIVRENQDDIERRADDQMPASSPAMASKPEVVTPQDKAYADISNKIDGLTAELADPATTDARKTEIQSQFADLTLQQKALDKYFEDKRMPITAADIGKENADGEMEYPPHIDANNALDAANPKELQATLKDGSKIGLNPYDRFNAKGEMASTTGQHVQIAAIDSIEADGKGIWSAEKPEEKEQAKPGEDSLVNEKTLKPFKERFPIGSQVEYTTPGTESAKRIGEVIGHVEDPITKDTFAQVDTGLTGQSGQKIIDPAGDTNDIRRIDNQPTYKFPEAADLPAGVTADDVNAKREQVHAQIDALTTEGSPQAADYGSALKAAIEPHLNFLTGEDIRIRKSPGKESFGAQPRANGGIDLWLPSQDQFESRNARQKKVAGLVDTQQSVPKLVEEEVIHAAHYAYLRKQWIDGGKKGAFGGEGGFADNAMAQLGKQVATSDNTAPKALSDLYQPNKGAASDSVVGAEFMRMMVQRARTGQLSEDVTAAENVKQRGPTTFLQTLLSAAKRVKDVIDTYLNPDNASPGIQDVYHGVNQVLDKYGNIQPFPEPASTYRPRQSTAVARQLGEGGSLVNENAENYKPPISADEAAARKQASQSANAFIASGDRGVTPAVRRAYKDQLQKAQEGKPSDARQAAMMHVQMELAGGNNLDTPELVKDAKERFETNLQQKFKKKDYQAAIEKARENPLEGPAARRNPEDETATTTQTKEPVTEEAGDDEQRTKGRRGASSSDDEGQPEPESRGKRADGTAFNKDINRALETGDLDRASAAIERSGNPELHRQFFDRPVRQAADAQSNGRDYAEQQLAYLKAAGRMDDGIRGQDVRDSLVNEKHNLSSGKSTATPEDDWFAKNRLGMDFITPDRWEQAAKSGKKIVDWSGDFSDHPDFQKYANEGASMKSPETIGDKFLETKAKGTPRSMDIASEFGPRIDDKAMSGFDQEFGKDNWVVKPKNASHSRDVFFPDAMRDTAKEWPELMHDPEFVKKFMVQEQLTPALADPEEVGDMDATDTSMGRVHVVTDAEGNTHVVPFATIDYSKFGDFDGSGGNMDHIIYQTPEIFSTPHTRGFESAAHDAIASLPEGDRNNSMYSVEVMKTPDGYRVVELNPNFSQYHENGQGGGANISENYAVQDAILSAMKGELPLHAKVAMSALEKSLGSEESPGYHAARSPEMEELDGKAHKALDDIFDPNTLVNERQRLIKQGGRLRFGDFTPQELEVMSQPKESSFFAAKEFFDKTGGVLDNADHLLRNPEVHGTGLDGAERTALYKMTMIGLDRMRSDFWSDPEGFYAEDGNHVEDAINAIDKNYANFGTEVGRIASSMKDLLPFLTGRRSIKDYTGAILQQWKKRFGDRGMGVLQELSAKLNKVSQDNIDGVVTRPEAVAFFRRVLSDLNEKDWRAQMRKTLATQSQKLGGIVNKVASRAAEMAFGDLSSEPALQAASSRILSLMGAVPRADNAEEGPTILSQALGEVTRGVGREAGLIPKKEGGAGPTDTEKLAAILKNPDLYDKFVTNLEERMATKFEGKGDEFSDAMSKFVDGMKSKSWMEGLQSSLVNEKMREMKTSLTKIAQEEYGSGKGTLDTIRDSIFKNLGGKGVPDEVLHSMAEDLDSQMNNSVEKAREVWAGTPGAVAKTLKQMSKTVGDVAKMGFNRRDQVANELAKTFVERLGLANTDQFPHADRLASIIKEQLDKMVGKERKRITDQILKNANPEIARAAKEKGKGQSKSALDQIVDMSNVGSLTNEKVYAALAKKLGLPEYNADDAQKIQEWGQRIGDMPGGSRERLQEASRLRDFIESRKGLSYKDMLVAGMYTSLLSGPSTHMVHSGSKTINLMGEVYTQSVLHPDRIPQIFTGLFQGIARGATEWREVMSSGIGYKLGGKVSHGNPLEFDNPVYTDPVGKFLGGMLGKVGAKYVVRALQASDMMFYKAAQEVSFAAKTGYDGSGENWAGYLTAANKELAARGTDVTTKAGQRAVQLHAASLLEDARIKNNPEWTQAWQEAHGEALDTTMNGEPKGWLGRFSQMVSKYTNEYPAAKVLVPFTRIVANILNNQIQWSPFGLGRYAFGKDFMIDDGQGGKMRDPKIRVKALTATVALGGLATLLAKHHDDEDPWFTIYGSGPADAGKKRLLYEQGWKPNTIKIGSSYISYLPTPLSLSLASLGTLMDKLRDKPNTPISDYAPQLGLAFVQGTLNQSFLSGIADLFSAFESADPESKVKNFMAKSLTLPIPNLAKQIDQWADPSVQQSNSFLDAVIKQVPVFRHWGPTALKPMLNVFGQEVERTPAPLNLPFTSRFVTQQKTDDPVLAFVGQNQLTIPNFSKGTRIGNQQMDEDEFYDYVKQAGPKMYEAIRQQIPSMQSMSKEQQQEVIDKTVQGIKAQVRDRMRANSR